MIRMVGFSVIFYPVIKQVKETGQIVDSDLGLILVLVQHFMCL